MAVAPTAKPQMTAEFYSAIGSSYESAFGHDQGLHNFLQKLLPYLPPNARVLDVGCGTGSPVATTLAAAGHHVTGIDIAEEMIRLSSRAVPNGHFEVADMTKWMPPPSLSSSSSSSSDETGGFDAVLAILSLFPLDREAIERQVAKFASWTKPGGIVCICSIPAETMDVEHKSPHGYDDDDDGKKCVRDLRMTFMDEEVRITIYTREGWQWVMREKGGCDVLDVVEELFVPPVEAKCDEEVHYFIIGRKKT